MVPSWATLASNLPSRAAIAALAADPEVRHRTGSLLSSWELAREYGFTDYDGRRPDWGRQTIDFSGGALDLLDPQGFSGKIAGFVSPDMVQLAGDWTFSSFSETGNGKMGNLTLSSGGTTNTFHFLGDYTASDFSIASGATTIIGHT